LALSKILPIKKASLKGGWVIVVEVGKKYVKIGEDLNIVHGDVQKAKVKTVKFLAEIS
jgi:hypothetical protein